MIAIYNPSEKAGFPDFLYTQRQSFRQFLNHGLIKHCPGKMTILNSNTKTKVTIDFYANNYKLRAPELTIKQAIVQKQTYSSAVLMPLRIRNEKQQQIIDWFVLADLPLITKNGHFIVNGSARLIINQIVRSPGVYFQKKPTRTNIQNYTADLIAQRGTWLRFETDRQKKQIWARMKNQPKLPMLPFLYCLGLPLPILRTYFYQLAPIPIQQDDGVNSLQSIQSEPFETIWALLSNQPNQPDAQENVKAFFYNRFFNRRTYDLSIMGRLHLNQTLGTTTPISYTFLTPYDIVLTCFYLLQCVDENHPISDIDHLQNRVVKTIGQLMENQWHLGLVRLQQVFESTLAVQDTLQLIFNQQKSEKQQAHLKKVINPKIINSVFKEFFGTNPLSQLLDQTNPLAEITHKRRLSCLGIGGIQRETAGMDIRGIHPSHYGRICPIETPEGQNAGLVNSFTVYASLKQGRLQTPLYQSHKGFIIKDQKPKLFTADQESRFFIAPGDLCLTSLNTLPKGSIPSRQSASFQRVHRTTIDYIGLKPMQMMSIATSCIPFVEHDDGNRALMGSNMQRQAVPLIRPTRPIVATGLESRVIADLGTNVQAKQAGFVSYVDSQRICIYSGQHIKQNSLSVFQNHLKTGQTNALGLVEHQHQHQHQHKVSQIEKSFFGFGPIETKSNNLCLSTKFQFHTQDLSGYHAYKYTCFLLWQLSNSFSMTTRLFNQSNNYHMNNYNTNSYDLNDFQITTPMCIDTSDSHTDDLVDLKPMNKQSEATTPNGFTFFPLQTTSLGTSSRPIKPVIQQNPKATKKTIRQMQNKLLSTVDPNIQVKSTAWPNSLSIKTMLQQEQEQEQQSIKVLSKKTIVPGNGKTLDTSQTPLFNKQKHQQGHMGYLSFENTLFKYDPWSTLLVETKQKPTVKSKHTFQRHGYTLSPFFRSNQDTYLFHRPRTQPGQWVEKAELLADNSSSDQGQLAVGQNLLVGYTPWEGYNYEDAVLLNQRLITEDVLTSLHIERYETSIEYTQQGPEQLTTDFDELIDHLDENAIVKVGSWVREGDILVGKKQSIKKRVLTHYEKLLYDLVEREVETTRDTSFRVPLDISGRVIHVELIYRNQKSKITPNILQHNSNQMHNLPDTPPIKHNFKINQQTQGIQTHGFNFATYASKSLKKKLGFGSKLLKKKLVAWPNGNKKTSFLANKNHQQIHIKTENQHPETITRIFIYIAEKRKIQAGDKISGRHGNKGIISKLLPEQDMPYLPDGTPLDVVLNPLGIPSRMNVGQIFECLLGFAGYYLNQTYRIQPFDEMYGPEASRSLVYSKLYEARLKTGQKWLFNPNFPGKVRLFDGRTGQCFEQPVTVGKAYILKLIHQVDEKIHARSTGPYCSVTQQPVKGRSKRGGQRVGEMEVWAFEGFGAAYILQELLTVKSDDMVGRQKVFLNVLDNKPLQFGLPESFNVLVRELQCLCLNLSLYEKPANQSIGFSDIKQLTQLATANQAS